MVREQRWEEFRREFILVILVFDLRLCILLILCTRYRKRSRREKVRNETHGAP